MPDKCTWEEKANGELPIMNTFKIRTGCNSGILYVTSDEYTGFTYCPYCGKEIEHVCLINCIIR